MEFTQLLILLLINVYIVLNCVQPVITELHFVVSEEHCGRTVDLAVDGRLELDYNGTDFGRSCVLTVNSSDADKMICIQVDSTLTFACSFIFEYYIGDMSTRKYTCYDFYSEPLCTEQSTVFAVFQPSFLSLMSVHAEIYTSHKTTTRFVPTTTTTQSSFALEESSSPSTGTIIGIASVVFVVLVAISICFGYIKRKGTSEARALNYNAQYRQENQPQQVNMSAPPPQYTEVIAGYQQQRTTNSTIAGYQVHPTVTLTIRDQNTTPGQSFSGPVDPSAPPPPYPGT